MENTSAAPPASSKHGSRRVPTWVLALIVPVAAGVAVLVTSLVSDGTGTGAVASEALPGTVTIKDFSFSPDPIEVPAGSTLTVVNADGTVHTLTAADGSFDTGHLDGGKTATFTVGKAGTYKYFCEIHQYMTGSLKAS
jgi:plastocyanin